MFKVQSLTDAPTATTAIDVQWQSPEVVGKWCVLKYNSELYPGIITGETHIEVCCIQKMSYRMNRFFWPTCKDIFWYLFEDIVFIIPPPGPGTDCHMETEKEVWAKLAMAS